MLVSVHKTIFEFDPDITPKKIKNWICATDNEDKSTIFDYILENVDCNQDYYDKIMNLVDTDFTSDASLLLQKVKKIKFIYIMKPYLINITLNILYVFNLS